MPIFLIKSLLYWVIFSFSFFLTFSFFLIIILTFLITFILFCKYIWYSKLKILRLFHYLLLFLSHAFKKFINIFFWITITICIYFLCFIFILFRNISYQMLHFHIKFLFISHFLFLFLTYWTLTLGEAIKISCTKEYNFFEFLDTDTFPLTVGVTIRVGFFEAKRVEFFFLRVFTRGSKKFFGKRRLFFQNNLS